MGNKQREWDITFINIAKEMAKHSTCIRKQVGAILVKNGHIVSTGYNGVPHGVKHCNEVFKKEDMLKPDWMDVHGKFSSMYEVHAEQNCIIEMAKNNMVHEGSIRLLIHFLNGKRFEHLNKTVYFNGDKF